MMRKGFTLMEVNLAMMIMAGGILSIVGLYSFGFRESRQSREDVAGAAFAETALSPLVMAISATNLVWSKFRDVKCFPSDEGWGHYMNDGKVTSEPNGKAVFDQAMNAYAGCAVGGDTVKFGGGEVSSAESWSGLKCGLVVMHEKDSPVVKIGFRATRTKGQLMAMPLYYTEVRFQGVVDR